ncbi:AAA family ATPase [Streptomyces sp. NPDC004111]|uniref:nucleotide-binding protein n=1 Tax=Streptomyces sp. NPDC004111 TaxID=3364690 RepID=UPI00367D2729
MSTTQAGATAVDHAGRTVAGEDSAMIGTPRSEALPVSTPESQHQRVIYAIGGLKGGVGKTTFAMYLALYWALKGRRVLVLDADPISSSAFDWYEEARKKQQGEPMPFDLEICPSNELDKILAVRWLDYDVVVVDCGGESAGVWTSTVRICDHFVIAAAPKKAEVKKVKGTFDTAVEAVVKAGRVAEVTPHVVFTRVKAARDQGQHSHNEIMREKMVELNMPLLGYEVPDLVEYEDAVDTLPTRLGHFADVFDEMHDMEDAD